MCEELTSRILKYMQDKSARYAIALEGEWGSGKTRYCEGALTNKLYPHGFDVLRVSLFGVTSTEEVYARLAMAMTRLASNEDDCRVERFFKGLVAMGTNAVVSYGTKKLSDMGITLSASPQMLTAALCGNQLLVFDDVERSGTDEAFKRGLFGLVNDLIEAQGCKVMFVTNCFDGIPEEIQEKVIWKRFRFEPNPEELVKDIVLPRILVAKQTPEFDVSRSLVLAARATSCRNARAMIKVTELLKQAVSCETMSDSRVDVENREHALTDFARYAFLTAMNDAPTEQTFEDDDGRAWVEGIHRSFEYNMYQQLWVIKAFLDSRMEVKDDDIAACLKEYIAANYGGSPETMALKHILDGTSTLSSMDDAEVADLAMKLATCISETVFDLAHLNQAIQVNMTLRKWGFEEALSDEELLIRAKELVDMDAEEAYRKVHREYVAWRDDWSERYSVLADLDEYIVDSYEAQKMLELSEAVDLCNPETGRMLASSMQEDLARGGSLYLGCKPELIAELFASGNADSQYAIYELIVGLKHFAAFRTDERACVWAEGLCAALSELDPQSRMGRKRLDWALDGLHELVD